MQSGEKSEDLFLLPFRHTSLKVASMSSKKSVSIVWVPGAWHGPEAFKATGDLLEAQGYENGYVHLASVGPEKALADPYADVQVIRKVIEQETDKGNDVIVATHSYGGVPGCNACEGYLKKDTDGKPGVLGMIFICSFAVAKGTSLWMGLNSQPLPWFIMKGDMLEAGNSEEIFYQDCSVGEKAQWRNALRPHSLNTFKDQVVKYEAYKEAPSAYILCTLDNAIPIQAQEGMVQQAGTFIRTETLEASHSPFISMPDQLAKALDRCAQKVIAGQ